MQRRGLLVVVAIAVIAGGLWWLSGRGRDDHATPMATGSPGSARGATAGAPAPAQDPAHLIATVTDAKGPLADATVRLAGPDGDISIVKTGRDGVAHADGLAPGEWKIGASAPDHEPAAALARELHAGETTKIALVLDLGGRTLSGVVKDASGGPVAGARVDAARLGGLARPSDAVASATTGVDGRYKVTTSEGQLLVAVAHPDYAPQSRHVDVGPSGATADFSLVPGGVIEGVVRDEQTREPVASAIVEASRDQPTMMLGEASRRHATAGGDGHFRITGLRPGSYELGAQAGNRCSRTPTVVGLGVAEQVTDVVIIVTKGATIRGTVVDGAKTPVANVDVTTFGGDDRRYQTDQPSDAKGRFVLEGLPPGHYELFGDNDDYDDAGRIPIDVGQNDVDGLVVPVQHAGRVTGHVEPRQICDVRIDFDDTTPAHDIPMVPMSIPPKLTAADGEFALHAYPISYELVARCPSGDQGAQRVVVGPGSKELVVQVSPGASIAGGVVDSTGKPIAAITVMAAPGGNTEHTTIVNGVVTNGAQALTDAQGRYEIRGLAASTHRMHALDRGRPIPQRHEVVVTLAVREHKTGVDLAIDRSDGVVRGTVTGPDGKPLADAWVSVAHGLDDLLASMEHKGDGPDHSESHTVTVENGGGEAPTVAPVLTDSSGHFEIGGLARVSWSVIAEAQAGKLRGRATKVTPDATVTILAGTVAELRGVVHVSSPPASFTVELEGPTRAERTFAWSDGSFSFGRVDPGAYVVRVTSSAGNGEASVKVDGLATLDITLASNAIVIGKVVDKDGKPLGGVAVTTVPDTGDPDRLEISLSGPPPTTQPDGTFKIETKTGKVIVVALTPARPTSKRGVVLEAGKTVDIGTLVADSKAPPKP